MNSQECLHSSSRINHRHVFIRLIIITSRKCYARLHPRATNCRKKVLPFLLIDRLS